jgi:hypothetical protein
MLPRHLKLPKAAASSSAGIDLAIGLSAPSASGDAPPVVREEVRGMSTRCLQELGFPKSPKVPKAWGESFGLGNSPLRDPFPRLPRFPRHGGDLLVSGTRRSGTPSQDSQGSQDLGESLPARSWELAAPGPLPKTFRGNFRKGLGSLGSLGKSVGFPRPVHVPANSRHGLGSLGSLGNRVGLPRPPRAPKNPARVLGVLGVLGIGSGSQDLCRSQRLLPRSWESWDSWETLGA